MSKLYDIGTWLIAGLIIIGVAVVQVTVGTLGINTLTHGLLGEPIGFLNSARITVGIILITSIVRKSSK